MIPSSSVEELEDAFNTAKNALETELSFKEEQLQVPLSAWHQLAYVNSGVC
jgi:hypothetical protein